jgi:hypothetical protein
MSYVFSGDDERLSAELAALDVTNKAQRINFAGHQTTKSTVEGATMLHVAAQKGYAKVCEVLIQNGATVSQTMVDGATPLAVASFFGNLDACRVLLQHGALPNARKTTGSTPLFLAAQNGHRAVCDLLLDNKADVNAQFQDGASSLFNAAQHGHYEVCVPLSHGRQALKVFRCANCCWNAVHLSICPCKMAPLHSSSPHKAETLICASFSFSMAPNSMQPAIAAPPHCSPLRRAVARKCAAC